MKLQTRREFLAKTAAACSAAVVLLLPRFTANASDSLATTHKVEIRKFKFVPDHLVVKLGDTIVWTNDDIAPHTATADGKSWDTGTIKKGQSISLVVSEQMTPNYFCRFHPHMKASLQVEMKGS